MTQTTGRIFDGVGRIMTDAIGMAESAKREIETIVRSQAERILSELDLVRRDEFEAARDMAANARAETERLAQRVAEIEARLAARDGGESTPQG
jgi:BMFP domain-containing protein YqiC